jgi:predicted nucleic acid-binding protein
VTTGRVIVVDAGVLIAHFDEHDRADRVLLDVAGRPLRASPVTLAEVLVGPVRQGRLEAATAALNSLAVREVAFGRDAPARLARLRAETDLKLPDCCVVLAAQDAEADAIIAFDDKLWRAAAGLGFA